MAKLDLGDLCVYCGEPSTCRDHPRPLLVDRASQKRSEADYAAGTWVPACRNCNQLLGALALESLPARARHVAERLERKHRRLLDVPEWTEDDLLTLAPKLRRKLRADLRKQERIARRLAHARQFGTQADVFCDDWWATATKSGLTTEGEPSVS